MIAEENGYTPIANMLRQASVYEAIDRTNNLEIKTLYNLEIN